MSRRNSYQAKQQRKLARQADLARREAARKNAVDTLTDTLKREVAKLIETYNDKLGSASLAELKDAAKRRKSEGDSRICAYSKLNRAALIEMLTLGEQDADEYVRHGLGG